jgi:lipid-binding SYLF domain-containing protein
MASTLLKRIALVCGVVLLVGCSSSGTPEQKRADIQKMRSDTLAQLYRLQPSSRQQVQTASGYGVFSNVGVNVLLVSGGGGSGVVHDNKTGKDTYMNMGSAGVGPGIGVKDFRAVFVFTTPDALERFVNNGWTGSAEADAAAKAEDKGGAWAGAVDLGSGVKLYQMTENGLALQATLQGTKYWKSTDLN